MDTLLSSAGGVTLYRSADLLSAGTVLRSCSVLACYQSNQYHVLRNKDTYGHEISVLLSHLDIGTIRDYKL